MFRVEFFCDDKKLASALHALTGISHGQPTVQPVVNAIKQGNGLAAASGGKSMERFAIELKKRRGKTLSSAEIKSMMKSAGMNVDSASYFLKQAKNAGLVHASGSTSKTVYKVL